MVQSTTDALICDAVRTPIGRYGGALSSDIIDAIHEKNFTLYKPDYDGNFFPLTSRKVSKAEYDEHLAFETFPVLEKRAESAGGLLLHLPK